jgi:iron transport multicopper oxidase
MHRMQLIYRSNLPYNGQTSQLPSVPMMRDTIEVAPGGYIVLRFKADNAGVALCKFYYRFLDKVCRY